MCNLRIFHILLLACAPALFAQEIASTIPPPPEFFSPRQIEAIEKHNTGLANESEVYSSQLAEVNEKYTAALEREKAHMIKINAGRAATALTAEILRIKLGDTERSDELEAAPDNVRKMRTQYDAIIGRLARLERSRRGDARLDMDERLADLEAKLRAADRQQDADSLNVFRQRLRNPAKPTPVETTPPEANDTTDPEPPTPEPELEPEVEDTPPPPRADYGDDFEGFGEPKPMSAAQIQEHATTLGAKPTKSDSGYEVMLKSISAGDVTEIKVAKIKRWGAVRAQMFDGEPYWSVTLTYPTVSMFGTFDTEGMALIRGSEVKHWLYTGSGDSIP